VRRRDLPEDLPTENLAFDRQAPSLVVVEPDSPFAVGFLQHLVLGAKVPDHFPLLPVDQAGEDGQEEVPGLQDGFHGWSDARWQKGEHRVLGLCWSMARNGRWAWGRHGDRDLRVG